MNWRVDRTRFSKTDFQRELDEMEFPTSTRATVKRFVEGKTKYGAWLRKNDPVQFEILYIEKLRERGKENVCKV